ncbi:EAL domain-containing protein [Undibacterium sp. Jales W-56]|uniref:putative bifunctional diguanylate cyclase/phosphodiesterase n=1 Tax=Undibacterium sp. Jales W-56 TaxID=2897325 RepID=UPI0021CEDC4F|nr:GGDEF domain-containing phosphodiesterase [Undibacterium sp. Jales W-56]MCU6434214.1 EAL domain-containing protein [Undibacterium sp. Jales W-56]
MSNSVTTPAASLTELASVSAFFSELQKEITAASEASSLAVLVMSLQRSDRIAALLLDEYAEEVKQQFLLRVHPILRSKDKFVFVNENECWFILPQLSSEALSVLAVHRLLNELHIPIKVNDRTIFLTPSIGIACAPMHTQSAFALLRIADTAQKHAHAANLKFLMAATEESNQVIAADLPELLGEVLDANSLVMMYQPKVDLASRRMVSVEALVRWPSDHPQAVPTNILIDVAERTGLIESLTLRVLNNVMRDYCNWKAGGEDILIWVNLSTRLLELEQLPKILQRVLHVWDVPTSAIGLEITESAFIHDIGHSTDLLFELKKLGFHLSIDDFGTGYSSLAYLRRFPIDELKIDCMFVQGMSSSIQDKQIVQSIIDLGHNFGLPVIAEGVETAETLAELEALGCDQVQGYFFARPMTAEQILAWRHDFHSKPAND